MKILLIGTLVLPVVVTVVGQSPLTAFAGGTAGGTIAAGNLARSVGTLYGASSFRESGMNAQGLCRADSACTTVNGARVTESDEALAAVASRLADTVGLSPEPLLNSHDASDDVVIKNGEILQSAATIDKNPEDVVQQQVNAYNARDIEAFLAAYSAEVKIYNHPDTLLTSGREAMRKTYQQMFQLATLHCKIVNRIRMGHFVIDQEQISGAPDGSVVNVVAIYEVREGLIRRVWFIAER